MWADLHDQFPTKNCAIEHRGMSDTRQTVVGQNRILRAGWQPASTPKPNVVSGKPSRETCAGVLLVGVITTTTRPAKG
jgi:hypothetical protein